MNRVSNAVGIVIVVMGLWGLVQAEDQSHSPAAWLGYHVSVEKSQAAEAQDVYGSLGLLVLGGGLKGISLKEPGRRIPTKIVVNKLDQDRFALTGPTDKWGTFVKNVPAGAYRLIASTKGGQPLTADFSLDHNLMPPIPVITTPPQEAALATAAPNQKPLAVSADLTITWEAPPKSLNLIRVTLKKRLSSPRAPAAELMVELAPDATSYTVPDGFLQNGTDYDLEVTFVAAPTIRVEYDATQRLSFAVSE